MKIENKTATAVMIVAATLVLMVAFQMKQVMAERGAIQQNFAAQEATLKQVRDVSAQFESLAVGTAKLAGEGNKTAVDLIAQMKKIGVNVNPNATAGQKSIEFNQPEAPQPGKTTPEAPATAPAAPAVGQ